MHPGVRARTSERGALLIEIMLGLLVLALAAAGSVSSTVSGLSLEEDNRDAAVATDTLRHILEEFEAIPLDEIFARFNANPADDPDGTGTAMGSSFALDTQRTSGFLNDDPLPYSSPPPAPLPPYPETSPEPSEQKATKLRQPLNVEISFPVDLDGNLAENVTGGVWGTQGWDLDGDGTIAGGDRSQSYKLIPVHVRVSWVNKRGGQSVHAIRILAPRD